MPDSYSYMISNNKISPILARIRTAAKPDRFGRDTLQKWGFAASNDRAMVGVLKELGFLNEGGVPTPFYDRLRDPTDWPFVLAERMREVYAELFSIDPQIYKAPEGEIKGAISRVTGQDDESVKRYYATFKTLAGLANFEGKSAKAAHETQPINAAPTAQTIPSNEERRTAFHYNIQIHLPATSDISVYNAIFRSLKENLGV